MSDEPYRPGGEHCPKCGYRHDGRCPHTREQFIKRCQDFYVEKGFAPSVLSGWDARQPEIDALKGALVGAVDNIAHLQADYAALAAEVRRLAYDDPVNGHGGWTANDRMHPMSGDYSQWPAIAKALKD